MLSAKLGKTLLEVCEEEQNEESEFLKALDSEVPHSEPEQAQVQLTGRFGEDYAKMMQEYLKHEQSAEMKEEEEKKEEEEETLEQLYSKYEIKDDRFFTDYMQSMMMEKYRTQIPEPEGSFALFYEGRSLLT